MRTSHYLSLAVVLFLSFGANAQDAAAPDGDDENAAGTEASSPADVAEEAGDAEDAEAVAGTADETADGNADAAIAEEENDDGIDLDDPAFADLDLQTYEEDEDDFVPTEEIPADQAIPFPSDI